MKNKFAFTLLFVASPIVLASCGENGPAKPTTYNLTFHQTEPGDIEDVIFVVTPGETIQPDAWDAEPDINPKEGYTAEWEEYNVEEMTGDVTVEPIYTLTEYTATFKNRVTNETLGTSTFTVESTEIANIPELPVEKGYTYRWEEYTIQAKDLTIYCDRTADVHTIKFFEDEEKTKQVGDTLTFTIETESIEEPAVPEKAGYDGYWPEYDLKAGVDLEVVAQYEVIRYYLQFMFEGDIVDTVTYNLGDSYGEISKPALPEKKGYTVSWPSEVTLEYARRDNPQIVEAVATANKYVVSYEGTTETTEVTYDQPYTLLSTGSEYVSWVNGGTVIAENGDKWTIDSNVTLEKKVDLASFSSIDFEDGENAFISIFDKFEGLEVVDGEGVSGSKALKATYSGGSQVDAHLKIDKSYLDAVFSDASVKALTFYAKGNVETNNFRHKLVDKSLVGGSELIISCYEANANGYGITNDYKKFYLTREVWQQMDANDWFIQYGGTGPLELYLDNFSVSYESYFDAAPFGLENGYLDHSSSTATYLRNPITNGAKLLISGSYSEVDADYENFTEGIRSIHVKKAVGEVHFYLRDQLQYANLPDEGIFFDLMLSENANGWWEGQDGGAICDGNRMHFVTKVNESVESGRWYTFHFTKDMFTNDGRFLILQGSITPDIYIDNIRLATENVLPQSFETPINISKFGDYVNVSSRKISNETESNQLRDKMLDYLFIVEWGGCKDAEIVKGIASKGAHSLKLEFSGQCPIRFSPMLYNLMSDEGTVSMDLYTEDMTFTNEKLADVKQGEWTTVTFKKNEFSTPSAYRIFQEGFSKGTLYIDNLVVKL